MTTYAKKVNSFYNQKSSHFVTLSERLGESLNRMFELQLEGILHEFTRRHRTWQKFTDLNLCRSLETTMDKILIDTTMQRQINFRHILKILQHFRETMVLAIQVYEDPTRPGYYIAWDGQHTAIVLYILATKVFGEKISNLVVPITIFPVKMKAEIRRNFILLNGDAKEPLEFIDIYRQMVCGVRIDKATDPAWINAEKKQKYFEEAGLFATSDKFGDEDQPGAFTLLADTIMSKSENTIKDPEVTRMFSEYWAILGEDRPVGAKEARQLYEYFDACFKQDITVDVSYLVEFVQFTKDYFQGDFSANGPFWSQVKNAYTDWYLSVTPKNQLEYNKNNEPVIRGFVTEWRTGGPFLIAQLKHSTNLTVPKFEANNGFVVNKSQLWDVL